MKQRPSESTNVQPAGKTRREFLKFTKDLLLGGAGVVVAANLGIGGASAQENSAEGALDREAYTPREEDGFVFPEEVRGNEEFFGSDILITIDDCNRHTETRMMFETLKLRGAKATFFPNTNYLDPNDETVVQLWQEIHAEGFEIGYHTTNHNQEWTQAELETDFAAFTDHMRQLLNDPDFSIQFVRPPYGNWSQHWMNWVRDNGLTNTRWNFVPNSTQNSIDYFRAVLNHPQGGRIILLHPRPWDTNWLDSKIDEINDLAKSEGGRITNLSGEI